MGFLAPLFLLGAAAIALPVIFHLIRRTTRELIQAARGTNRLIMGITEDMPPDRWQGNLMAISDVINEVA